MEYQGRNIEEGKISRLIPFFKKAAMSRQIESRVLFRTALNNFLFLLKLTCCPAEA
jgi:hypothetical protein